MTYYIYEILVSGKRRYIGYTDNLIRRQKEHIRDYKKGSPKYLYKMTRENSPETIYELRIVREFTNKGDAKRYEAYLILHDFFNNKELWQSFPTAFKYF
jgi:predicted GIY-YIG superfamily endonuclease